MKKALIPSLFVAAALLTLQPAAAQTDFVATNVAYNPVTALAAPSAWKSLSAADIRAAYPQMHKRFEKAFRGCGQVRWFDDGKMMHAFFRRDGQAVHAAFDQQQKLAYSVADASTASLPAELRNDLLDEYPGYSLYHLRRVDRPGQSVYEVVLSNGQQYQKKLVPVATPLQ